MANRCAALDPTWTHLPVAGHCHYSSWLFPGAAAFENEALTSALRASMSPANVSAASSASYPTTPSSSSTTSSASDLLSAGGGVGHDAPAAPAPASRPGGGGPPQLARAAATTGPKAGRVTKRKPRPSRRPPVTYITADPANFRRMVQEVTGFPVSSGVRRHDASEPAPRCWPAAPPAPASCALPTLDTSAFLMLDRASAGRRQPEDDGDKSSSGCGDDASPAMAEVAVVTAVEDGDDGSLLLELEAMARAPALVPDDFPTLDCWGIL